MTQAPRGGQTAPRNPGYGSYPTAPPTQHGSPTQQGAGPTTQHPSDGASWSPPQQSGSRPDTTTDALPTAGSSPLSAQATAGTDSRSRAARNRGPRRARLQLRHINPWTVLKFSCVLSVALFFVWLIVIGVLYGILDGAGIIGKINDTVTTIQGGDSTAPVTAGVVFGGAAIIGVINVVLFIALSTIGSLIYNLCADLVGGVEVTLSER